MDDEIESVAFLLWNSTTPMIWEESLWKNYADGILILHKGKVVYEAAVRNADMVLIAAALLIIGIGLYTLFFGEPARLPEWLDIRTLDDLKDKLVSVIVAVLAVNFFTRVIEWDGGPSILYMGAAIGLVIVALAAYGALHKS